MAWLDNIEKKSLSLEERVKEPFLWVMHKSREATNDPETWELYTLDDATISTWWDINEFKDNLKRFFDWVDNSSRDQDFSENWSTFRTALDKLRWWNIKEAIWKFFWWILEIFTDKKKTNESFWDPSNKISRSEYRDQDLLDYYTSTILSASKYRKNPRNLVNYMCTTSGALDQYILRNKEKEAFPKSSLSYLIQEWTVKSWDTILVNKPDSNFKEMSATRWIQTYDTVPYTHQIIITSIDINNPENFEFIHSADWIGVVEDTRLNYTQWDRTDFMVMNTPEQSQEWVIDFCKKKLWGKYDRKWMVVDSVMDKRNSLWKNDDFYCSSLYLDWLESTWLTIDEGLLSPWDILQVVNPIYIWNTENR